MPEWAAHGPTVENTDGAPIVWPHGEAYESTHFTTVKATDSAADCTTFCETNGAALCSAIAPPHEATYR